MSDCNSVYTERNRLIVFLARCFPSYIAPVTDPEPGFTQAVYIETPEGQLSWHIPDSELHWFDFCAHLDENNWDGHSTEAKYERLSRLHGGHVKDQPEFVIFDTMGYHPKSRSR